MQAPRASELHTVEDDLARPVCIDNRIVSGLRVDDVGIEALSTDKGIVARAASERVVTLIAFKVVVARPTVDCVVATATV
ncbi:hypothetical protein UW163_22500 (plasmid) [Ralstonia solanacearum]|nr:hypothetical protein UW163_22500 [Ralstonia solanacearum]AMP76799.1 hypothetical protein RALBFv3_21970 [Ralstonia solanacearum]OAI69045.1 hypothetical protein RSP797_17715 [Ralstonia solanacearum]